MLTRLDGLAKRWFALSPLTRDVALAVALTVATQIELQVASGVQGHMAVQAASFAVMTSSVALRRRAPLAAAITVSLGLSAQTILGGDAPVVGGFIALLIVTYSTGASLMTNRAIWGEMAILAGVFTYPLVNPEELNAGDEIGNAAIFIGTWLLGRLVRRREGRADELEQQASQLQATRDEDIREAIEHERAAIARELHDIVAHGLSLMTLHAGAARQVLDQDAGAAKSALSNIEETGRRSLEEMHRLLVVLREDGAADADRTPPATLDQVRPLADKARAAGFEVDVAVDGIPRRLPQGLEVSAYRIIQEALTNVLKHSNAATVEVRLTYREDALEVRVRDDGAPKEAASRRGGNGLIGMRERVAMFSGSMAAGPSPAGGWEVRAMLPTSSSQ